MFPQLKGFFRRILPPPKRPIKLTTGGWIFILYTIGVGAGAINTGNNLLYLIFGVFLGLIMASGVLSDTDLWRLKGKLVLPDKGEARQNCHLLLALTNLKKWFPAVSVTAEIWGRLRGKPVKLQVFFPFIGSGETVLREFIFIPPTRGYFGLEKIYVYTRFPFGLLWKRWTIMEGSAARQGMFVYPALYSGFDENFAAFSKRQEQDAPVEIWGDGTTASGIRNFKPGDSPKRIHWKATAKRGGLEEWNDQSWLLKEMERDGMKEVFLGWPGWSDLQNLGESELENFIRYTASLVWSLRSDGHKVWLMIFPTAGKGAFSVASVMEFLSLYESGMAKEIFQKYLEPIHGFHEDDAREKTIDLLPRFWAFRQKVMPGA